MAAAGWDQSWPLWASRSAFIRASNAVYDVAEGRLAVLLGLEAEEFYRPLVFLAFLGFFGILSCWLLP